MSGRLRIAEFLERNHVAATLTVIVLAAVVLVAIFAVARAVQAP